MQEDIKLLKKEFKRIKDMGLVKSLRKGYGGIGYTFETLLNKEEDQECKPDFGSIELKCKLGYSNAPIKLFTCAPKRKGNSAINYIFDNYSYYRENDNDETKIFCRSVFSKWSYNKDGYEFKLKVDYLSYEVIMQAFNNGEYLEDVCVWDFKNLETKLKQKLSTLAIIYGYDYTYSGIKYYKYVKMELYKLRGFFEFLQLIANDKISITFYLKSTKDSDGNDIVDNHGVMFRIKKEYIPELFYRIY